MVTSISGHSSQEYLSTEHFPVSSTATSGSNGTSASTLQSMDSVDCGTETIPLSTRISMIFSARMHILQKVAACFVEIAKFFRRLFNFSPTNDDLIGGEISKIETYKNIRYAEVPREFIDPFTNQVLSDPLQITRNGRTYYFERTFLEWALKEPPLNGHQQDRVLVPIFGTELPSIDQFHEAPQFQLLIYNWLKRHYP